MLLDKRPLERLTAPKLVFEQFSHQLFHKWLPCCVEAAVHAPGVLGKPCWQAELSQMGLESDASNPGWIWIPQNWSGGGAAVGTAGVPSLSVLLARLPC